MSARPPPGVVLCLFFAYQICRAAPLPAAALLDASLPSALVGVLCAHTYAVVPRPIVGALMRIVRLLAADERLSAELVACGVLMALAAYLDTQVCEYLLAVLGGGSARVDVPIWGRLRTSVG